MTIRIICCIYLLGTVEETPSQKLLCSNDNECPNTLACLNRTCTSPCSRMSCGSNALCEVENHAGWCRCNPGYTKPEGGKCISGNYNSLNKWNKVVLVIFLTNLLFFFTQAATITHVLSALNVLYLKPVLHAFALKEW